MDIVDNQSDVCKVQAQSVITLLTVLCALSVNIVPIMNV